MSHAARIESDPKWTGTLRLVLGAIVLFGILLGWLGRQPVLTLGGDEATYVVLSQSIEEGQYRDEFLLGTPAHAKYPPGMPAWLAAVRVVAGGSTDAPRAVNLLLLAATTLVVATAAGRIASPVIGVAAGAAVMFNPPLQYHAGTLLSETLYTCLTIVALAALVSARNREARLHHTVLAVALALCAVLTRSIGITLIAAVVLTLVLRRRRLTALLSLAVLGAATVGWYLYVSSAAQGSIGRNYGAEVAHSVSLTSGGGLLAHLVEGAKTYLVWVPSSHFGLPSIPDTPIDNVIWAILVAVPALVGLGLLLRRWVAAGIYVILYCGVLLLWPFPDGRLAVPLQPLVIIGVVLGIERMALWSGLRRPAIAAVAAGAVLAALGMIQSTRNTVVVRGCRESPPYQDPRCYPAAQRDWIAAADFIRDSLPASAVIATLHPAPLYVETSRLTVPWERLYTPEVEARVAPDGPITHALVADYGWGDMSDPWPDILEARCTGSLLPQLLADATSIIALSDGSDQACRVIFQTSPEPGHPPEMP
jgi:4-amino-4-deoxy-L-arabinose transferase-like glycosyltransferase